VSGYAFRHTANRQNGFGFSRYAACWQSASTLGMHGAAHGRRGKPRLYRKVLGSHDRDLLYL
jgi:hypothetical protein